jgi:ribosomal protein L10
MIIIGFYFIKSLFLEIDYKEVQLMGKKAIALKEQIVESIAEKIKNSQSCVVIDYKGLTVEEDTELRKKFREANVEYKVYKNTMVRRAAEKVGNMEKFDDVNLVGPNAFAFGVDDAIMPAKIAKDFAKTHPKLELKMAYIEGEFYDAQSLEKVANIPSREVLIAKLLGSFKAPVSNFVYMLDALSKKKAEEGQE